VTEVDVKRQVVMTEHDEESHMLRIIVYADSKDTVDIIEPIMKNKCETCEGIFCHCTVKTILPEVTELSNSHSLHDNKQLTILLLVFLVIKKWVQIKTQEKEDVMFTRNVH